MWLIFCFILLCVMIKFSKDEGRKSGDLNDHEVYFFEEWIDKK